MLFEIPIGQVRLLLESRPDFSEIALQALARRGDVFVSYESCLRER